MAAYAKCLEAAKNIPWNPLKYEKAHEEVVNQEKTVIRDPKPMLFLPLTPRNREVKYNLKYDLKELYERRP